MYSAAISAIATLVLVFSAVTALRQTSIIIDQQKSEEFLRLRAYVYPVVMKLFASGSDYVFQIQLKNSGQTPAINVTPNQVTINHTIIMSEKIPEKNIGPGDTDYIMVQYKKSLTPELSKEYPFTFEFVYQTYENTCFSETLEGILIDTLIPNDTFYINSQKDLPTSCPN
jgi:hypothetical protein